MSLWIGHLHNNDWSSQHSLILLSIQLNLKVVQICPTNCCGRFRLGIVYLDVNANIFTLVAADKGDLAVQKSVQIVCKESFPLSSSLEGSYFLKTFHFLVLSTSTSSMALDGEFTFDSLS